MLRQKEGSVGSAATDCSRPIWNTGSGRAVRNNDGGLSGSLKTRKADLPMNDGHGSVAERGYTPWLRWHGKHGPMVSIAMFFFMWTNLWCSVPYRTALFYRQHLYQILTTLISLSHHCKV